MDDDRLTLLQKFGPYDEPLTDREREAMRKGDEDYARGECISRDEVMRKYGFGKL